MRYELRSIGIWALIKVSFFLNLIFGFIFGIFYSLILIPMTRMVAQFADLETLQYESDATAGMLFVLPFFFALFAAFINTMFVALIGAIYNGIARITGGFEMRFEKTPETELLRVEPVDRRSAPDSLSPGPSSAPAPPPPYRPQSVSPAPTYHQDSTPPPGSPVVDPYVEPDEEGPRPENP